MLPNNFSQLIPYLQPELEILETHQVTQEFYQEVKYRQEFEVYCQWYYETAESHRQELQKMRGDLNLFRWFFRQKS
jgi:hypothetical protein